MSLSISTVRNSLTRSVLLACKSCPRSSFLSRAPFTTSSSLRDEGSKTQWEGPFVRLPYDERFPPTPLDFWEAPQGAYKKYNPKHDPDAMGEFGGDYGVNEPGYYLDGKFVYVEEMVPQYVVPELLDSKLSPYVPYSAKTVSQPAMTAEDLFETLYRIDVEKNTQEMIDNGETPANFGAMMERMFKTDNAPGEKKKNAKKSKK